MTVLSDWQELHGLSDEGAAALISERVGRPVTKHGYKTQKGRPRPPESWIEALGLDVPPEPEPDDDDEFSSPGRAGDDEPPRDEHPSSASRGGSSAPKPELPADFDAATAREALISIYKMVGGMVAQAQRDPEIGKLFALQAPVLADDWIAVARVDQRAAKVLKALGTAGPAGKLMWDHVTLVIAIMSKRNRDGSVETPRPQAAVTVLRPHDQQPAPSGSGAAGGAGGSVDGSPAAPGA